MSDSDGLPLRLGDALARCDRCYKKLYLSDLSTEWTGLAVCQECFDPRPPELDFRVPPDDIAIEGGRPDQAPVFIQPITSLDAVQVEQVLIFDPLIFDESIFQ